jgi:hypothetical protein
VWGAVVGDVDANVVDVAIIVKMAVDFKTVVLEGKAADDGGTWLEMYVFFVRYISECILVMCVI